MEKLTVLILTRKTTPPIAIQKMLEAVPLVQASYAQIQAHQEGLLTELRTLFLKGQPDVLVIDGEYAKNDRALLQEWSGMAAQKLKTHLLGSPEMPESVSLLRAADAIRKKGLRIYFFVDSPSQAVTDELERMGATTVWGSLNKLSDNEAALHKVVGGAREIARGVKGLFKSVGKAFEEKR